MTSNGPHDDDPLRDATVVRPRGAGPAAAASATPASADAGPARPAEVGSMLGDSSNPLLQAATPLLLLAVQLRHSTQLPDVARLREQTSAYVRRFESQAQAAGQSTQTIMAARYVLCAMLDESVLNAPWGEQSGWSQKTLLVTFHGESYGGAKFFQILDRLCADFNRHLDLIELMYVCLALGFGGRYQIESGGRARLADIQEDLYRRIRGLRTAPAAELAPHWRGIEDRRNPLIRYVPLWVIVAAAACVLLGAFIFFHSRLNDVASPVSAQLAQIGLEDATPPAAARSPAPAAHKTLKQLLAPQEQAGRLQVIEKEGGRELVRLGASDMFASGGVTVSQHEIPLLHTITAALNQVHGRVVVVGHTDDQPIHSLRFKDNYALSAARAKAVVKILAEGLDNPGRLESSGAGSSQPIALPPNTPANRARNRRVEILFIPES